jgi:uncharacterized membrane protein YsdA (DUF1294 family)
MDFVLIGLVIYICLINLIGVIFMIVDKRKSQKGQWRISENKLIVTALIGAATGMFIASRILRHKTRKTKFYIGFPLFIALHLIIMLYWF